MPPIIVAFFILIGAMTGPPLIKGIVTPKDASSRSKLGEPVGDTYRTWASRPWLATSDNKTRTCDVTFFALTTRRKPSRLLIGGVEQALDTSWSAPRSLREGERRYVAFEFRDPVGGAVLACQEQAVVCHNERAFTTDPTEVHEGSCAPDAKAPLSKGGKPRLTGHAPPFTMSDPAINGAYVDVTFEITGTVTEEWYCPAIEVTWPDETVTKRESDCPPFDQRDTEQRFRWTFNHGFPGGTWKVKACLYKSGATLACNSETEVRVLGGGTDAPFMGSN